MNHRFRQIGPNGKIRLNLTSGQTTHLGRLIGAIHYSKRGVDLLSLIENTGYPHNGGEHSLAIYGTVPELITFIDLVVEMFMNCGYDEGLHALMFYKMELSEVK